MKRSSYRGEHKGSTVKARSKTYASRVLNSALAFVLVVGLAPSMSFAGEETVTVRTDDGALTEQVIEQTEPTVSVEETTPAEVQTAQSPAEPVNQEPAAKEDNAEQGLDIPVSTNSASSITLTSAGTVADTDTSQNPNVEYYKLDSGSVTFNVSFTDSNFAVSDSTAKVEYSLNGVSAGTVSSMAESEGAFSGSFTVTAEQAKTPTTVSVTETDKSGTTYTETYGKKVVIDTVDPQEPTVTWEAVTNDAVSASESSGTYSYIVKDGHASDVAIIATVTVKEDNLRFADTLDGGDGTTVTKITTSGEKLTASLESGWDKTKDATDSEPAEYTCKVKFSASEAFSTTDDNRTPSVTVTAVDWSGRTKAMTSASTVTMKVTDIDGTAPTVTVKKGENVISSGDTAYFKKDESATLTVTEKNYDATKLVSQVGDDTTLTLGEPNANSERTATISFGDSGTVTTEGSSALSVSGTDLVGNPLESPYSATLVYDNTDPTATISYTTEKASGTVADAETAYINATKATVNVALADANPGALDLDTTDACKVTYKLNDGAEQAVTLDNEGKAAITLGEGTELADNDTVVITATATDKAGNSKTYTATIVADLSAPTYSVVWEDTNKLEDDELGSFYSARVATVTIVDDHFDADHAKACITATKGTVTWSGQTATVTYNGENKKDCQLEVAYTSLAGTAAAVTDGVDNNVAEAATYDSGKFNIVVSPIMDVQFSETPGTLTKDSTEFPLYLLDKDGKLDVTVRVIDPAFSRDTEPSYTIGGTVTPNSVGMPTLSDWSGTGAVREAKLTFTTDCDVANLKITPSGGVGTYVGSKDALWTVGSGATELSSGEYVYEVSGSKTFVIDKTPPTLVSVKYETDPVTDPVTEPVVFGEKNYYKGAAKATINVTEHNLNSDGTPVDVKLKTGTADPVSQTLTPGSNDGWSSSVSFPAVANAATSYVLTVSGKDLAGRALVEDENSGLAVAIEGEVGTYTGNVVIDAKAPTLAVTKGSDTIAKDSTVYYKDAATLKATVSDTLIDPTKLSVSAKYKVNGTGEDQTLNLSAPSGELVADSYEYEFALPADDEATNSRTYTVTISGTDAVGNELTEYTATVVIDPVSPELVVTLDPFTTDTNPYKTVVDDEGVPTYYYNTAVEAQVAVTDSVQLAADGVVAKVFGAADEKSAAGKSFTSTKQTWSVGSNHENDSTKTVEVTGTDAAGNPLKLAGSSVVKQGLITDSETGAVSFKANVVLDTTKPTVAVTYTSGSTTNTALDYKTSTADADAVKVAGNVSIKATFTDANFDKDAMTFKYAEVTSEGAGTAQDIAGVTWDETGKVATFTIAAPKDDETLYQITIDGKDLAGNDLAGDSSSAETANPYKTLVKVDTTSPKLTVTYTPAHKTLVAATGTSAEKRYFDDDVTVAISIEESDFDATKILINGAATTAADWDSDAATHTYTLKDGSQPKYTSDGTFKISGTDDVGNPLEAATGMDFAVTSAGLYESSIIIDKYSPNVDVVMNKPRAGQDGSDYYADIVTATVTVKDKNFDADANKPGDVIAVTPAGKVTIPTAWTPGTDAYSVEITFEDSDFGASYGMTVSGSDLASHQFIYHYGNNNASTVNPAGNNYTTSATGDTLSESFANSFVVDSKSPDVEIKMGEGKITTHNGRDYFGTANANGQLVATITVTDPTFIEGSAKVTDADGNNLSHSGWQRNGNAFTTTVAFNENKDGKASTLKVVATDKINTLNSGAHKVEYSYGDAAVSGNAAGGNVSTVDASNPAQALTSSSFVLDLTAPELTAKESTGFATKWVKDSQTTPYLFYTAGGSGVTITMTDANDISAAEAGAPFALSPAPTTDLGAISTKTIELIQSTTVADRDKNTGTMSSALVKLTDYVGNYSIWNISANGTVFKVAEGKEARNANSPVVIKDGSVHPTVMILDTTGPSLTWGATPGVGQFYTSAQSADLNLTELNFDYLQSLAPGRGIATIYRTDNAAGAGETVYQTILPGDFGGSASDWAAKLNFTAEGHYRVVATFDDLAGNPSNSGMPLSLDEFTIDWTAPTCTITWDNNDARNGMYYRAARTATITVTEHNFLASDFTVETTGAVSGWSDNGDTHTCTVSFATDGRYTLSVSGHDRAGNQMTTVTEPEFVIDLTAPTIDFSNVTAQTAYNGEIAPVINYHDEANFDTNGMTWTLTGNKHGGQTYSASQGSSGNDGTVTFADFPRQVEVDDIYTLQAHLTDMAGNEADNSITFSVNRFGSNFIILDEKTFTEHKGYLAEPIEIRVQEINVSGALNDEHGVSVTHGLSTENLTRKASGTPTSDGFYVESGSDNAGWSSYTYHIGSGNFEDDGNYHVVISSTDTATNLNNSASYYDPEDHRVADAEVSFILDTADPMIDGISIVDGRTYDSGADKLTFTVTDNIGFDEVKVVVDGDEQTVEPEMGGLCTVDLPAKAFTARDMQIVATDLAGRTAEAEVLGFHWTDNFVELHLPLVVGGVIVVAAAVVGGVLFVRRRNGQ